MQNAHAEPPEYVVAHLREALARDPRVNELELNVQIAAGKVFITGDVATPDRQRAVAEVARELLPEWEIHNGTAITPISEPTEAEQMS